MPSLIDYAKLMRLHRPVGFGLLLWPTLTALWIAAGHQPSTHLLCLFIAGTFLMRSAGCVINDLADRHWDGRVARTQDRPLVTGAITPTAAWILFGILISSAGVVALNLHPKTLALAAAGATLSILYPFLKRHTDWPQLGLSLAFAWGIPMAFMETLGHIPLTGWLLFGATAAWIIAYDTEYAMADRADDLVVGIRSTAIWFGQYDCMAIAALQGLTLMLLILVGKITTLGGYFWIGLLGVSTSFIYQHYLIRTRNPSACLQAFRHNQWGFLILFIGIVCHYGIK